eukprot:TRINITY_DN5999_c2_g2_i1.p1 TRINITY_DN5999_c2_g2~~TRINITY_DN5999_c2_g2_i1.p1  ORF type:complete len:936 (-),score=280.00 TRINITY_DN5999_c2_g2_i1:198-3005(-)
MAEDSAAGAPPAGDITDISNSPAFVFLDSLYSQGRITQTQLEVYKGKYAKLHEVVLKTYDSEKKLLAHARELNKKLLNEKHKLEKANSSSWESNTEIGNLRREVMKAENELLLAQEQEALLHVEATELKRQVTEQDTKLEQMKKLNRELVEPRINALKKAATELREDTLQKRLVFERLESEQREAQERVDALNKAKDKLEMEKINQRQLLTKAKTEPEKVKKQADVVQTAASNLTQDTQKLYHDILALENDLKDQAKKKKELEEERVDLAMNVENQRAYLDQRQKQVQQQQKDQELAKEQQNVYMENRVKLEMQIKEQMSSLRRANEQLMRQSREKESMLKLVRRCEFQLANAQSMLPSLETMHDQLKLESDTIRYQRKKQDNQLEDLRNEVDVYISNYLKQESIEGGEATRYQKMHNENKERETELAQLADESRSLAKEIAKLTQQREVKARESAKAVANVKGTVEQLKMKNILITDLRKRVHEVNQRLKELCSLYEMVKNERNKYVNLIQSSTQALAEMREKIKILNNEVEILRNESLEREKALVKERLEMSNATNVRDNLRSETNKNVFLCRQKQEEVDKQIAQIDKLNSIINSAEEDMLRLKKQYELAVEDRNFAGIQLIDRNDELCILYEKLNIQENVLKNGEIEFRNREEDHRLLTIEAADYERSINVQRKLLPKIPELEKQVLELQQDLISERKQAEKLSKELESPTNLKRWRALKGADPTPEKLAVKIQDLEEKLNDKKERLLEKELILEEITHLSDRLRAQANSGRTDTLELSKKVNELQNRIKVITQKMMATVAELSMHQATAMKLQQEKHSKEVELEEGRTRLERGEAPNDEAEREWYRRERERLRQEEARMIRAELRARGAGGDALDAPSGAVRTTAAPRPNAYIPPGLGLPKPYGNLAPFKPSEQGSSMRHIRKPQVREIEI